VSNVTDRERAERAEAEVRRLSVLAEASKAFAAAALDLPSLLETIAWRVAEAVGGETQVVLVGEDGSTQEVRAGQPATPAAGARRIGAGVKTPEGVSCEVLAWRAGGRPAFDEDEQRMLDELAERAALAIGNARLYRQAQEAIRARDEFLSIASHELRTPVTSIKGFAQVALRAHEMGRLDEERLVKSLTSINRVSDRLAKLVEDLLDVSRLRTERLRLTPERVDLAAFVNGFVTRYSDQIDGAHRIRGDVPRSCVVAADPLRLEQVLLNLLDNAVKYSPGGGEISVKVRRRGAEGVVSVTDRGVGIPSEAIRTIFEPFGRAVNAERLAIPGMGLGLYICRSIVERLGGRIWAESGGEAAGATVSISLPRRVRQRAAS
jgi:signal transduction histidine kinase